MTDKILEEAEAVAWWSGLDGQQFAEYVIECLTTPGLTPAETIPILKYFTKDDMAHLFERAQKNLKGWDIPDIPKRVCAYFLAFGYAVGYIQAKEGE